MALLDATKSALRVAMGSAQTGNEIAAVIDAGSGTLSALAREHMRSAIGNPGVADAICDAINVGSAIDAAHRPFLDAALCSVAATSDIVAQVAS